MSPSPASLARRAAEPLRHLRGRLAGLRGRGLRYVTEGNDWVISRVGQAILGHLARERPELACSQESSSRYLHNQLVHFGSLWTCADSLAHTPAGNRLAATIFHGSPELDPNMARAIKSLVAAAKAGRLAKVVTACSIMRDRLAGWGVPAERIEVIPLGVDTGLFQRRDDRRRRELRASLGIPEGAFCIGSFQKDGLGWGEGAEPKLIKGPDLLVEAIAGLARGREVFVLLTGPSRGYVKKGLAEAGVRFRHDVLEDFSRLPDYYNCLDVYLMTSREEGGPLCLPEAMACGVPLVTTRVGMAPDMVRDGVNGLMVEVEDLEALTSAAQRVADEAGLAAALVRGGLETAREHHWPLLAERYYRQVYEPLLRQPAGGG